MTLSWTATTVVQMTVMVQQAARRRAREQEQEKEQEQEQEQDLAQGMMTLPPLAVEMR